MNEERSIPTLETGFPVQPCFRDLMADFLRKMKVAEGKATDESFVWPDSQEILMIARKAGLTVRTWKLENGTGYRVWKTSNTRSPRGTKTPRRSKLFRQQEADRK